MQTWALNICIACVMVGVLEIILPKKEYSKSIKTVLALYILVSICYPMKKMDWGGLLQLQNSETNQSVDYSDYQLGLEKEALQHSLQQELLSVGIEGTVTITAMNPMEITVRSNNPEQAYQIICQATGNSDQVVIKNEDNHNDE